MITVSAKCLSLFSACSVCFGCISLSFLLCDSVSHGARAAKRKERRRGEENPTVDSIETHFECNSNQKPKEKDEENKKGKVPDTNKRCPNTTHCMREIIH